MIETGIETEIADATIVTVEGIVIATATDERQDGIEAAVAAVNVVEDGHHDLGRGLDRSRETEGRGQGLLEAEETIAATTAATGVGIDVTATSQTADHEAEDEETEETVVASVARILRTTMQ